MGRDRRVIDSAEVEAKVDSGNEALQVHTFFDSTADLDTIEATLTNIEKALNSIDTDYLKAQLTDGTDDLSIVTRTESEPASGIVMYGRWFNPTPDSYVEMPVAAVSDAKSNKGLWVIPITPMTGGSEEGVFTRGFIPENPINSPNSKTVSRNSDTVLIDFDVTEGNTLWITDINVSEFTVAKAGVDFYAYLRIAGSVKMRWRVMAGQASHFSLRTPIKATTEQEVRIYVRQWSSGDITLAGSVIGFETTDSELD